MKSINRLVYNFFFEGIILMPTTWHRFTPSVAVCICRETKKGRTLGCWGRKGNKTIPKVLDITHRHEIHCKVLEFQDHVFCLFFAAFNLQSRRLKSHSQHKSRFSFSPFVCPTNIIIGSHLLALLAHSEHEIKKVEIKIKFHMKHKHIRDEESAFYFNFSCRRRRCEMKKATTLRYVMSINLLAVRHIKRRSEKKKFKKRVFTSIESFLLYKW